MRKRLDAFASSDPPVAIYAILNHLKVRMLEFMGSDESSFIARVV